MTRKRPDRHPSLDALLGGAAALVKAPDLTMQLPVGDLAPGAGQPRRNFDAAGLERLAESIRREGILQPLLVRPVGTGHEIVAGERRWRAAQLAGLTEVPVVVRNLTDHQARVAALIENLVREDLNLVDEVDAKLELAASVLELPAAEARGRLMQLLREEPGEQHAALQAAFTPLGEEWTTFARNKLRVLNWPPVVLEAVRGGMVYTVASLIVGAPAEHHEELVGLAQGGAGWQELQDAVRALKQTRASAAPEAARVARVLGSRRFVDGLAPEGKKALERWLAKMPPEVREALDKSRS
ncbi:ParB/RepB/Spo0J family partition protein [uncultured Deinococcus sp.]|uniref:ParB N-terminal domain-containing protein n=1 Tax=uncultured Deinococcus sp. TaxID=158789 RepID=UPI00258CBF94|nr:ParB/RepB/Spo0J family partition protein [uncultured Deinococcus sp.]